MYTYNNDRQLSGYAAQNAQGTQYDRRMDRTMGYDEFGRMNSSESVNVYSFRATYNQRQDQFGNVINSTYHNWQSSSSIGVFTAEYLNNRVTSSTDKNYLGTVIPQTWEKEIL